MNNKNDPIGKIDLSRDTIPIIEQIAELMPGGFFIYKAQDDEELLYFNSAMLDIFGCSTAEEFKELTGNTFRGIVHPDDLETVEASIASQIKTNTSRLDYVEYRIIRKDGSLRYVDDYGHFVHTEDFGDLYYVFINDATEKRLAQELERQQKLNRIKMDFLFNISHDIRTPMNSIMGFTALAKSHLNDPALLGTYLDMVDRSNHHMLSLIDDIIEMSSIESGKVILRSDVCDLESIVSEAVDVAAIAAEKKHITVTKELHLNDRFAYTDEVRLLRILSGIVDNAAKFTGENGRIEVTAEETGVSESGHARFIFCIRDNGCGISKEFLPRVYDPFEREETSTKTGYPGAGLGLSIAKTLTNLMGGTITAESVKGEGAAFTVSLPMKLAKPHPAAVKEVKPVHSDEDFSPDGKRILIVEDIEINRMLAETVLKKFGFTVESVPDGCDAVDAVRDHSPGYYDLILMDIQMPVMNGYEATRAIRALGRSDTSSLPIIALSANASAEDKRRSLESGMNSHIAKPFETDVLLRTLRQYLA